MARDGCPSVDALRTLLAGNSTIELDGPVILHLARCEECRRALATGWDDSEIKRFRSLLKRPADPEYPLPTLRDGEVADDASAPELPCVEGYELLNQIGRGGSGVVYRARQIELDRLVALKMLSSHSSSPQRAAARMKQESLVIARLRHPHVVTIHEVGEHGGTPYLCLELIEGGSLADRIAGRPVPPIDAARVTSSLARTIQDIHDAGIIHRDLKPANILLGGEPGISLDQCILKVSDFGLSKGLDTESPLVHTKTGEILGTPSYMAPEQLSAGRKCSSKAVDIYGLGAILFELLTGQPPFFGETPLETALQIIMKPTPRPRRLNSSVPPALDVICTRCLSKQPQHRYPSAVKLAQELEAFLLKGTGPSTFSYYQAVKPRISSRVARGIGVAGILMALGLLPPIYQSKSIKPTTETLPQPVRVLPPVSRVAQVGQDYLAEARVELVGGGPLVTGRSATYSFDLQDRNLPSQERFIDHALTRNARFWEEPRHDIRYWGPIDPGQWFEVTYRFPFDFPITSARFNANVDLFEDSSGSIEVSSDPSRGWITISSRDQPEPNPGEHDISQHVRGSRIIYLRARLKGRDDGLQSCLAQFLRTSTSSEEHSPLKGSSVFQIRASDLRMPQITGQLSSDGGKTWAPLRITDEGTARIAVRWQEPGLKRVRIRASVDGGAWEEATSEVLVIDQGSLVEVDPFLNEIEVGAIYHVNGLLLGRSAAVKGLSGLVDYGDGTKHSYFPIDRSNSFSLRHIYQRKGKYRVTMIIRGSDGSFTGTIGFCLVREGRSGTSRPIPVGGMLPSSPP